MEPPAQTGGKFRRRVAYPALGDGTQNREMHWACKKHDAEVTWSKKRGSEESRLFPFRHNFGVKFCHYDYLL
jgi:hypothetical protein